MARTFAAEPLLVALPVDPSRPFSLSELPLTLALLKPPELLPPACLGVDVLDCDAAVLALWPLAILVCPGEAVVEVVEGGDGRVGIAVGVPAALPLR